MLEPVIDGKEYVRYLRCQQHIKDTMTGAVDTSRDARFENIGGYKTSREFLAELSNFHMANGEVNTSLRTVSLIQVLPPSDFDTGLLALNGALKKAVDRASIEHFKLAPFWERIAYPDCTPLVEYVAECCRD